MRKFLFAASAGLICICTSCSNDTKVASSTDNSETQKALNASHVIDKAFESGDVSSIDSVVDADFLDHTDHGDVKGRDSLKAMITMLKATNKDMKMDMVKEAANDDYVFSWMHYTGTSDGAMGMPKGPYDMHSIEVAKFKDGKAVEHWTFMEPSEMMKMMAQQPGMDMKMDSTKMKK